MRTSVAGLLFLLFIVPIFPWPPPSPDRYKTEQQPLLEKVIKEQQMPGFAIAVVESNQVAYAHGFGFKNLDHKTGEGAHVTPLSLFHMASITKPFVAKLGEAYEQSGDKTQAVASYQKALELDPKLSNAPEALQKLRGQNQ